MTFQRQMRITGCLLGVFMFVYWIVWGFPITAIVFGVGSAVILIVGSFVVKPEDGDDEFGSDFGDDYDDDDFMDLEAWKNMDDQGNYETALALLDSEMNGLWNDMQSLDVDDPEYERIEALYKRDEAVVNAIYEEVGYVPED